jgi:predicted DCC family thiol-disulfide oxidoreductase YuxK
MPMRPSFLPTCLLLFGVPATLGIVALLGGPWLIEEIHAGAWPALTSLLDGRRQHDSAHYVARWREAVFGVLVAWTVCGLLAMVMFRGLRAGRTACDRYVDPATPGTLGAIRTLAAGTLLLIVAWDDLPATAHHAAAIAEPAAWLGVVSSWPALHALMHSESALRALEAVTLAALFGAMIGWRTRLMLVLSLSGYLLVGALLRQYSHFFHQGLVPWYVLLVLAVTPSGDGWSVDRLLNLARGRAVPTAPARIYGWGRFACWAVLAVVYVVAALSKLKIGGLDWWAGENLRWIIYHDTLNSTEFNWTWGLALSGQPDWVFAAIGLSALLLELLYPLVLFSRRARLVLPVGIIAMHVGIYFLQNVLFFDLMMLQLMFVDGTALRRAVAAWWRRASGRIEILYDGRCPLCRRTVAVLGALDLFDRLACLDFRTLDVSSYNAARGLALTPADLDREMYVVEGRRAFTGFFGYRRIARQLPALWPVLPLLYLPGVAFLGCRVYAYIARERLRLVPCDAACARRDAAMPPVPAADRRLAAPVSLLYGVVALSFLAWWYGIESYPVTAYPMYAERHAGPLLHYQLLAHPATGGAAAPVDLNPYLGPFRHNRLRDVLFLCFAPDTVGRCETHLRAIGRRYNNDAPPGSELTAFEIRQRRWEYRAAPADRDHGRLLAVRIVTLASDDGVDSSAPLRQRAGLH